MKASEIINALQGDISVFGDHEVAFSCDDLNDGLPIWIDGVGVWSDKDKDAKFNLLVCGECHHRAIGEKHELEDDGA